MVDTLLVEAVDEVADVVYELLLLYNGLSALAHHLCWILRGINLFLLTLLDSIVFVVCHIILGQLLAADILSIHLLILIFNFISLLLLNIFNEVCILAFLQFYHIIIIGQTVSVLLLRKIIDPVIHFCEN